MSDFGFYFSLGWEHIISLDALDHQLFVIALTVLYTLKDWKKVLILVTAFTIGHSITLALSTLDIIALPTELVEFLIPLTISITALFNIIKRKPSVKTVQVNYLFALFFGLIHGLGFANTLKFMLAKGQALGTSLLAFNLGLEVGQVIVVVLLLLLTHLILSYTKVQQRTWIIFISSIVLVVSLKLVLERLSF
ncbi:HupE/UreJ family protein [Aridibaculum aurantiacum]|uniref:HupE/UreJ family protein n=1 Tax=Aridibaculum aurantiacum TaxID=2810307 RepID=UPI001A969C02|nr:HupE/UreJ family protein [Aridibaculum aurantiacum]